MRKQLRRHYVIDGPGAAIALPLPGACSNFSSFLTESFSAGGDKAAIIVGRPDGQDDDVRSYARLRRDVARVARGLRSHPQLVGGGSDSGDDSNSDVFDFKAGGVALVVSPNHADYFAAVHGVLAAGGVVSPANPAGTSADIAFQLEDCGASLVFAHESVLDKVAAALAAVPDRRRAARTRVVVLSDDDYGNVDGSGGNGTPEAIPFTELLRSGGGVGGSRSGSSSSSNDGGGGGDDDDNEEEEWWGEQSQRLVADDQLAVLPYSSGTTGRPKGVMLTHRNLIANVLQHYHLEGRYWGRATEQQRASSGGSSGTFRGGWGSADRLVSPLPFSHVFGFTVSLNLTLYYQATVVTLAGGFDMKRFLAIVEKHKCTRASSFLVSNI